MKSSPICNSIRYCSAADPMVPKLSELSTNVKDRSPEEPRARGAHIRRELASGVKESFRACHCGLTVLPRNRCAITSICASRGEDAKHPILPQRTNAQSPDRPCQELEAMKPDARLRVFLTRWLAKAIGSADRVISWHYSIDEPRC